MYLIQLFLPLYDNAGAPFPKERYLTVQRELVDNFGGMTAYSRAPAQGLWQEDGERTMRDDLVTVEVMAKSLDRAWWRAYRITLEDRFKQEVLLMRSHMVEIL